MNNKDRKIQLFLQIFLLLTGVYIVGLNIWRIGSGMWEDGIFEFYNQEVPVFKISAGFFTGVVAFISSWVLWIRVSWAYGFSMFGAGLLFCYSLNGIGEVIYSDPYHAIPMAIILIVILQSIPFLIRRTHRHL